MTEAEYAAVAAGLKLIQRMNRAVDQRRYSDRPGARWFVWESVPGTDYTGTPSFNGVHGKARIYANPMGNRYEVNVYDYSGSLLWRKTFATMDAAFRNGERQANSPD